MAPITFYHFGASAPSRSVLLTFRNLDLDMDIQIINLYTKEQLNPDFIKINPQHTVPTIDDNGFILWESRAIMSYLVQSQAPGSSLYPSDLKQRAIVDQRMYYVSSTMHPRVRAITYPIMYQGETSISEANRKLMHESFALMEVFLKDQPWFAGENVTLADLSFLASMATIMHVGADISAYKKLSAWYDKCKLLPGYAENDEAAKALGVIVREKVTEPIVV